MAEKLRITNLSTRYLVAFKIFVWCVMTAFLSFLVYISFEGTVFSLIYPLTWIYILYRFYLINKRLYHVEFDDEFLYVIRKNVDILVPLENIKDINLISMLGHWEIIFYNAEQVGEMIYFKPSLLYPFNSKKKDELVNVLWQKINQAKAKPQYFQRNALRS